MNKQQIASMRFGKKGAQAEEDPKTVPKGIDGQTFFSPSIPPEVKTAVPLLHDISHEVFREILQTAISFLNESDKQSISFEDLQNIASENSLNYTIFETIFSGVYMIMLKALRTRTKLEMLEMNLSQMNIPKHMVADFVKATKKCRISVENTAIEKRIRFPHVEVFKWRVDVTISTNLLTRVMKPSIIFQMYLSNGYIKTFEVSVAQFHDLRYKVAKVLYGMQELEGHPIMRLAKYLDQGKEKD